MNDLMLQRCVDGELTSDEQVQFLESLGDEVVHWKRLACTLIADREVAAACREWRCADSVCEAISDRAFVPAIERFQIHEQNGHAGDVGAQLVNRVALVDSAAGRPRHGARTTGLERAWMPIVAGILGIALGLSLSAIGRSGSTIDVAGGRSDQESDTDAVVPEVPEAPSFNTVRFTVNSEDGPKSVDLPVVGSGDLRALASMESSIDPELREQLLRQGYQLQEASGVITLPIDDATRVAVPVQAVQVRHVGL